MLIATILGVWSIIIAVAGLAEVHSLGTGKALAVYLLGAVAFLIPMIALLALLQGTGLL
jgi:hypothetical protein